MSKVEVGLRRIRRSQWVAVARRVLTHAKGRTALAIMALPSLGGPRRGDPADMF
jgi:hypothetical protein